MNVQLADYDYIIVNTSSGKDSQTTLRFVVQKATEEGFPKGRIICAHADLGRIEWPGIFSPPAALMIAGRQNPELLAEYVAAEKAMRHTFRKDFPIEHVQQAIAAGEDWGKATDWVM